MCVLRNAWKHFEKTFYASSFVFDSAGTPSSVWNPMQIVDQPTTPVQTPEYYSSRLDQLASLPQQTKPAADLDTKKLDPANIQFIGFFLMLFVFGQVMANLALSSDHHAAWICGLIFSVAGLTIAATNFLLCIRKRSISKSDTELLNTLEETTEPGPHFGLLQKEKIGA